MMAGCNSFLCFSNTSARYLLPKDGSQPIVSELTTQARANKKEVFLKKANGSNFGEEMSSTGVRKNEEKTENLLSFDVIIFQHILSNSGS